jgi:hypothetical protein
LDGVISVNFVPTVAITLAPHSPNPSTTPKHESSTIQKYVPTSCATSPRVYVSHTATNGPAAFAMSFAPCEKAMKPEGAKWTQTSQKRNIQHG